MYFFRTVSKIEWAIYRSLNVQLALPLISIKIKFKQATHIKKD